MSKDWTGNRNTLGVTLGASNHTDKERQEHDYYATDPIAIIELLKHETFNHNIWECCAGEGHLSKVLEQEGYDVISSDLIDRNYGMGGIDFLKTNKSFNGDIITNPPYKYAEEFVRHSLKTVTDGNRVAMLLRIQFLEGQKRRKLFDEFPPEKVYVASKRIVCAHNGDFETYTGSAVCYAWFIWKKGYTGDTVIKWFN